MKWLKENFKLVTVWLLVLIIYMGCDTIHKSSAGPYWLSNEKRFEELISIAGVTSVFPSINKIIVRRKNADKNMNITLFAINKMEKPDKLETYQPASKEEMIRLGYKISNDGDVEGLGRFLGNAQFATGENEREIHVDNLAIFGDGRIIYFVTDIPTDPLGITLFFERMGIPKFPETKVINIKQD
jgi:hypothetical protein